MTSFSVSISHRELNLLRENFSSEQASKWSLSIGENTLTLDEMEEISGALIEKYDYVGLDADWKPTKLGVELEKLIDKFDAE